MLSIKVLTSEHFGIFKIFNCSLKLVRIEFPLMTEVEFYLLHFQILA